LENFDRKEQIVDYVAREQSKQIVEDRAQIKQIVDLKKRVFGREFEDQNRTLPKANQGAFGESKTRGNGVSLSNLIESWAEKKIALGFHFVDDELLNREFMRKRSLGAIL